MPPVTTSSPQPSWGPYANSREATMCLCRFTDAALGPDVGVIWSDGQACMLLRRPVLDADGFGDALIAEWLGPGVPPAPAEKPGFWERVAKGFNDAMTRIGQAEIAKSEADMAMGRAVVDWLSDKEHEHAIGLAFDILGIVSVALLFVPGVGEAEMGVFAAVRAGEYLFAAGRVTAGMAATGAALGAYVDGTYLGTRYFEGEEAAKEWDESPQAVTLSVAAAILALPDFAVGGVMAARDLKLLPEELAASRKTAQSLQEAADAKFAKADRLHAKTPDAPEWRARKIDAKAAGYTERGQRLAGRARAADAKSRRLQRRLMLAMGLTAPSTFVGTPTAEAYFLHDNSSNIREPFKTSGTYVHDKASAVLRKLLEPTAAGATGRPAIGHNLLLRTGGTAQSRSTP